MGESVVVYSSPFFKFIHVKVDLVQSIQYTHLQDVITVFISITSIVVKLTLGVDHDVASFDHLNFF